jgi:hypothetical protein
MRWLVPSLMLSSLVSAAPFVPAPPPTKMSRPQALQKSPAAAVKKKVNPMPGDAECLALGQAMSPAPFGPGETLDFDIDALGARAGTMSMQVLPVSDGLMPLEITVETNTFFNKIRKVKGVGKSYLNPKTLRPARYFEDAHENEIHRVADVSFRKNKTAHLLSDIDGQKWEGDLRYGNDITDVAGAVHLLRSIPVKEGTRLCIDVYGIRSIWRVWGTVLPREHVSLPLGEFETWHLAGEAARLDWPEMRREVHVWVSDDARRLPLAALGMIDLGAVRATLKAVSRPGEKSTRAQNKADIKW